MEGGWSHADDLWIMNDHETIWEAQFNKPIKFGDSLWPWLLLGDGVLLGLPQ